MTKLIKIGTAAVMALSLAACSNTAKPASTTTSTKDSSKDSSAEVQTVGEYTIYNNTNDSVTELYIYPTDTSDKGENLAGEKGLSNAHAIYATYDAGDKAADTHLTLEFTTKGGYTGTFTTLSVETAPISLIAEDAKTGATEISFKAFPATYTLHNVTGEEVESVYIYPTGTTDKGENLVGTAKANDGEQVVTFDEVPATLIGKDGTVGHFTIEFTTKGGYTGSYDNLSYETAPIYLISEDAKTGATGISFLAPEK